MARMRYEVLIRDERTTNLEVVALAAIEKLAREIVANSEYETDFATEVRRHRLKLGSEASA